MCQGWDTRLRSPPTRARTAAPCSTCSLWVGGLQDNKLVQIRGGGGPTTFLYIFVHVHFAKDLVAMYINVPFFSSILNR